MSRKSAFGPLVSPAHVLTIALVGTSVLFVSPTRSDADEPAASPIAAVKTDDVSPQQKRIAAYLTGAKFVGNFTDDKKPDAPLTTEEYEIRKCEKVEGEDAFRLVARIKYGSTDSDFPIDLKIPFSDKTPVITLDSIWIPGLGTFSARVLIHQGRYAGTWQHGDHGGHLFGKIVSKDQRKAAEEGASQ